MTRDEIIKGLECCMLSYKDDCDECPYLDKSMCQELLGEHALALLKAEEPITGETSDGYHTFNELYHHRAVLFSVIVANYKDRAWKSVRHHDGTMYDGMFIVGIDTPDGQATYHYDINPYWDMFKCRVREFAPEWDGHTPAQAIERIGKLKAEEPRVLTLDEIGKELKMPLWKETKSANKYLYNGWVLAYDIQKGKGITGTRLGMSEPSGRVVWYRLDDYGKTWRCWTSRPTDEQREAEPWNA